MHEYDDSFYVLKYENLPAPTLPRPRNLQENKRILSDEQEFSITLCTVYNAAFQNFSSKSILYHNL